MRAWPILTALILSACGTKAEDFPGKYGEAYCEWAVVDECLDASVREFNGWTDLETCIGDFGGRFAAVTEGCVYDKSAAKQCLKDMKKHPCSSAPDVPAACEVVFLCDGGTEDSGA